MFFNLSCADTRRKRRRIKKERETAGVIKSASVMSESAPPARRRKVKTKNGSVKGNRTERKEMLRLVCCVYFSDSRGITVLMLARLHV